MTVSETDGARYRFAADPTLTSSFKRTLNAVLLLRAAREPPTGGDQDGGKPRKSWVYVLLPSLFLGGSGFLAAHLEALDE
jgi:hypothetical protein